MVEKLGGGAATSTPRKIGTKRSSRFLPVRPHAHAASYSYDSVGVHVDVEIGFGDEMDGVEDETEIGREDWNS